MNLKILLKKIIRSSISIFIRNNFNLSPVDIDTDFLNQKSSISDAFCWRTERGYKTVIKFSNLVKIFFNQNSQIKILFFTKENVKIKETIINSNNLSYEILINKEYMNGVEDYGTFYIFHNLDKIKDEAIISNRCYVGYSLNNELPSFVHGNTLVKSRDLNSNKVNSNFVQISPFYYQNYYIQNNFSNFDKTEICICNPTSKKIVFFVNNERFELNAWNLEIINLSKHSKLINIKSKCMFLRPIIFNYKKNFFDVYHA